MPRLSLCALDGRCTVSLFCSDFASDHIHSVSMCVCVCLYVRMYVCQRGIYSVVSRLIGSYASLDTSLAQQTHFICLGIITDNREREKVSFKLVFTWFLFHVERCVCVFYFISFVLFKFIIKCAI